MTSSREVRVASVKAALVYHLPGRAVARIEDRGTWIRQQFRITLDDGEVVYLKIDADFSCSVKEAYIAGLLRDHGLPAPETLALDATGDLLPSPLIIQAHLGGRRMGDLLREADGAGRRGIYAALGDVYRRLHAIHHDTPGWIDGPGTVYPGSPNAHQYEAVIVTIGAQAVAQGHLSRDAYRRLQALWTQQRPYLDAYEPTLVTGGALHWTVYLDKNDGWHVTKVMDLADFCYWDPAWDLASLRYPSFLAEPDTVSWQAFLEAYGAEPDEKRLLLYLLMQRLDAAMGNYMAPPYPAHARWRGEAWASYELLIDRTEALRWFH
ncbi:MAG: phosphotransferase [Anaerolineae bacterium]|nr:phosphotransferase [Anaerolineae bacterium]